MARVLVVNAGSSSLKLSLLAEGSDVPVHSRELEAPKAKADLGELQKTLAGYNDKSDFYQGLSGTLRQLDDTLRSLRGLAESLERKPNSLIFGKPSGGETPKGSH